MGKLADVEAEVFETEEHLKKDMNCNTTLKVLWRFYKNIRIILDFEESENSIENLSPKQTKKGRMNHNVS